jgi:hypothetical protein
VFQRQAHRTDHGITILVPVNRAFAAIDPSVIKSRTMRLSVLLPKQSEGCARDISTIGLFQKQKMQVLSGLSRRHLKELMLYHSLAKRYELAEFEGLSRINPVTTFAGRAYTVNVTYAGGAIRLRSSWAESRIVGRVSVAAPMAVYELDRVLLPVSLFPARPHVAPAPAPCNEEEASVPPVPRVYGSAAEMADAPSSASCRPGAHQYVTYAAAAAFGALALTLLAL